jgi:hypothetical protein
MEEATNDRTVQAAKPSHNNDGHPRPTGGLRAAKAVARDEGVSDVTIWRRVRRGLLTAVNIAGKPYITCESLADFYCRAAAVEFAKPPAGAAGKSAQVRVDKEKSGHQNNSARSLTLGDSLLIRRSRRNTA